MRRSLPRWAACCLLVPVISMICLAVPAYSQKSGSGRQAPAASFTQDEIERLDAMEREWGAHIDGAVPHIRQKDYAVSAALLRKAEKAIADMGALLIAKGYDIASIDRLVAMDRLTRAYMNMARVSGYTGTREGLARNIGKVKALVEEARRNATEAREKFYQVPPLREVCSRFLAALDEFEREVRSMAS